jgi:hypothetical protein
MFKEAMPGAHVKRGLQSGGAVQTPDVDAGSVFSIECKVGKKPPYRPAWLQIQKDARYGTTPMAIIKEDLAEPVVIMQLQDFLDYVKEWWELTNKG